VAQDVHHMLFTLITGCLAAECLCPVLCLLVPGCMSMKETLEPLAPS